MEREIDFGFVQHMEQNHIITAMSNAVQRIENGIIINQQIRKYHDQAALFEHRGKLPQAIRKIRVSVGPDSRQQRNQVADLGSF